jgi:predicted AAA+ superfamily ATPase
MTCQEYMGQSEGTTWLEAYLTTPELLVKRFRSVYDLGGKPLKDFLWRGLMPGLINIPDNMVKPFFDSYIQTYIERDLRLLADIKQLTDFTAFLSFCAALSAQEMNFSKVANDLGVSSVTVKKWYQLLVTSYQCFELKPYHGNTVKRLVKKRKGYITDTGLLCQLQFISSPDALVVNPVYGAVFETFIIGLIRKWLAASFNQAALYHWRTAGGAEVDIILEQNGKLYPIEIKSKTHLKLYDARGIRAFQDTYKSSEVGIIVYAGKDCFKLADRIIAVPWNSYFDKQEQV